MIKDSQRTDIRKIGGGVAENYTRLETLLNELEKKTYRVISALDLADNMEDYIRLSGLFLHSIKQVYFERKFKELEGEGMSKRKIIANYEKTFDNIVEGVGGYSGGYYFNKKLLEIFKEALIYTRNEGIGIDGKKFREIYFDKAIAKKNELYKRQEEVVRSINRFFSIPITEEELRRYFRVSSSGRVEIVPESVSTLSYSRLLI